jgi:hypothetical protein
VTAAKATIEQGKNDIGSEIAAANQQNAASNFTLSVVKP